MKENNLNKPKPHEVDVLNIPTVVVANTIDTIGTIIQINLIGSWEEIKLSTIWL